MEKPKSWEFRSEIDAKGGRTVIVLLRNGQAVGARSVPYNLPASKYTAEIDKVRAWLARVAGATLTEIKG